MSPNIWQILNDNNGAVQALATIVLVIITALNIRLLKKQDEEHNRPRLSIFVRQREEWLNIVDIIIANYGNESARNSSFTLSEDLRLIRENQSLSTVSIVKHGMKEIPPGRELAVAHLSLIGRVEELADKDITINVTYKNSALSKEFKDSFILDFRGLVDSQLGTPPLYKIADSIEKMQKNTERIEGYLRK